MEKLEIERKFLLKSLPTFSPTESIEIDQFYLKNSEGIWERTREWKTKSSIKYIHTIKKTIGKGICIEYEEDVSKDFFNNFRKECFEPNTESRSIKKIRHIFPHNDLTWEIDQFDNGYSLIIAEVELPSKGYRLSIPKFIKDLSLMEVTGKKKFSNRSLAIKIEK